MFNFYRMHFITTDKLFEYTIAYLLQTNGYIAGVPSKNLTGRGETHQIDCVGIYPFVVPFVFPIRLICEAKCYSPRNKNLGIEHVRNLYAKLIDLEQTLPQERRMSMQGLSEDSISCSYHGALFSTIPFSAPAQHYANAYSIDLVPIIPIVQGLTWKEWMEALRDKLEELIEEQGCPRYCIDSRSDYEVLERLVNVKYKDFKEEKDREVIFKIIQSIIHTCPKFHHLKLELKKHHIGTINGRVVLFEFDDNSFQRLRKYTINHYQKRLEQIKDPFTQEFSENDDWRPPDNEKIIFEPMGSIESNKPNGFQEIMIIIGQDKDRIEGKVIIEKVLMNILFEEKKRNAVIPVDYGLFYSGFF